MYVRLSLLSVVDKALPLFFTVLGVFSFYRETPMTVKYRQSTSARVRGKGREKSHVGKDACPSSNWLVPKKNFQVSLCIRDRRHPFWDLCMNLSFSASILCFMVKNIKVVTCTSPLCLVHPAFVVL
jgi:hypothetical protein